MNISNSSSKDTAGEKPETRDQLQHPPPNTSASAIGEAATALVETRPSSSDHTNLANPHPEAAPTPSKVQFSEGFRLQSGADDAVVTQFGLDDKHQIQNANNRTNLLASQTNCSSMPLLSPEEEEEGGSASSGTEEEQSAFVNELANFFREKNIEFKHPKFYGDELNCLKLWRTVTRLGGYDKVTSCKMWRHVGDSFKPPKTCTTVSWTFRGFYEKVGDCCLKIHAAVPAYSSFEVCLIYHQLWLSRGTGTSLLLLAKVERSLSAVLFFIYVMFVHLVVRK